MNGNGLRQTPRAECLHKDDEKTLVVRVRRSSQIPSDDCHATLIDISRGGVKLSTDDCLVIGEDVSLTLEVSDLNLGSSFPANVRWLQPVDDTTWRVGCAFNPPLPEGTLASLASNGHVQRRQYPRDPLSTEAKVRWEGTSHGIPVQMVDVSAGGFCFRSGQDHQDVGRLALQLNSDSDSPALVRARVLWKLDTDDGCLFGCEFASSEDRAAFWSDLESTTSRQQAGIDAPGQRRDLRLASLVITFLISLLTLLLLRFFLG